MGYIPHQEPFKKLVNQGMIQGRSSIIYKEKARDRFITASKKDAYEVSALHIAIQLAKNDVMNIAAFKVWRPEYANAAFILNEKGDFECDFMIEKMSKRWYNVVNPDEICATYGADTLRLYEMFLGPLTDAKPWNRNGIDGVVKFLRKLWRLFHDGADNWQVSEKAPSEQELKILHKTIKKVTDDIEQLSFNTSVSAFMVCVNELTALKCNRKAILEPLLIIIAPYAPHITEELWGDARA